MRSYSLAAPGKINLHLEIIGDRSDGYHELAMILQSIELSDIVTIAPLGTDTIRLHCNHAQVPLNKDNLAFKAAELMVVKFPEAFAQFGGMDITIEKNLPVAAGLAGGSSNAAAVIFGLDLLWDLGLTQPQLQELGAVIGSDVPFCITGGTAIATGRGEKLDPLITPEQIYVVLAKYRSLSISTAWAYQTYRQEFGHNYPATLTSANTKLSATEIIKFIAQKDLEKISKSLHNDLEKVVLPAYDQVANLRQTLKTLSNFGVMMSGSGPTVFALCNGQSQGEELKKNLQLALPDPDLEVWVTKFSSRGIRLLV